MVHLSPFDISLPIRRRLDTSLIWKVGTASTDIVSCFGKEAGVYQVKVVLYGKMVSCSKVDVACNRKRSDWVSFLITTGHSIDLP